MKNEPTSRGRRWFGFALIGAGVLVAAFAVSYLIYAQVARESLDGLDASVPEQARSGWLQPPSPGIRPAGAVSGTTAPGGAASKAPAAGGGMPVATGTIAGPTGPGSPSAAESVSGGRAGAVAAFYQVDSLFPASATNPKYWDSPLWAGSGPYGGPGLPDGFDFVASFNIARQVGTMEVPKRIRIPAIGVDSEVRELGILDLGDSRSYETPAFVVGHIPGTANPGENGNGWYFGHLESPFLGEGNVFYRLPEIAHLLRQDPIDIVIEGESGAYLYRVIATKVVHQDALSLYEAPVGTVTLVACVPSRVYDHRLLVTAQLIAERS